MAVQISVAGGVIGEVGCGELMIDAQQERVNEGGLVGQDIRLDEDGGDSISTVASFVEISHGQGRECRLLVVSAQKPAKTAAAQVVHMHYS